MIHQRVVRYGEKSIQAKFKWCYSYRYLIDTVEREVFSFIHLQFYGRY